MHTLDFISNNKVAIFTPTKAEFIQAMARLNQKRIRWSDGQAAARHLEVYGHYGEYTCITINKGYLIAGGLNYYETSGYLIIKVTDIDFKSPRGRGRVCLH